MGMYFPSVRRFNSNWLVTNKIPVVQDFSWSTLIMGVAGFSEVFEPYTG
jgi:hypothetical protein